MLLDEPTNHLDMRSINILIQALQQYQGTFIVVSHDRFFVSQIANKIWWLEEGQIKEYPGTYDEYEFWRQKQEEQKKLADANKPKVVEPKKEKQAKVDNTAAAKPSTQNLQKLQKDFVAVERNITEMKQKMADVENLFTDTVVMQNNQKAQEVKTTYDKLKQQLRDFETEYEQLFEKIMEIEQNS